jgi:DNA-binding CsgD family transcriptional regulator
MYISQSQSRKLSGLFELLTSLKAEPCSGIALRQRLVAPIADLLQADYVASLVWDAQDERFSGGVCTRGDPQQLAAYEAHFQFFDPIAPKLHPLKYPTRVSQVIAQNDLIKSDFYQEFLDPISMYWGLNIFAHDGVQDVGDFRIWRARTKNDFDSNEIEMLRLLYSSLVNALGSVIAEPESMFVKFENALPASLVSGQCLIDTFVHMHGLSLREAQVAQLVSTGEPDKAIAKKLNIGYTSVRTYLSNGLVKLGLRNRKEIIAHFSR